MSSVIDGCNWKWPTANSWALINMRNSVNFTPSNVDDKICWIPSPSGDFSTKSAWEAIRGRRAKVEWCDLVWFSKAIPRYSMILWMAIKERLPTKDRLMRYGATTNAHCCFCNSSMESLDHLFFACPFSKSIWSKILSLVDLGYVVRPWHDYIPHLARIWKGKSLKFTLGRLCLGATVYWIWRERNSRSFRGDHKDSFTIIDAIKSVVRDKALDLRNVTASYSNRKLANDWGLPRSIFKDVPQVLNTV